MFAGISPKVLANNIITIYVASDSGEMEVNMRKQTVESLFKLPSMANSYLVAGIHGVLKEIKRIDILETPYPEVEKFLEPNEFIFTSFWNSKNDKTSRVNLVKSMIKHKCAGIGIIAGLNLEGKVDEEIIQCGDKHSFSVILIDINTRWSDIIKEFYDFHNDNKEDQSFSATSICKLLSSVENFYTYKNVKILCNDMSEMLQIPIIITTNMDAYFSQYGFNGYIIEKILAKIKRVRIVDNYLHNTAVTIYLNNSQYILAYYGYNSVFAIIVEKIHVSSHEVNMFHVIAPFIISHIDKLSKENQSKDDIKLISNKKGYYYFFIRKENVHKIVSFLKGKYIIYEINRQLNYIICLIDQEKLQNEDIYSEYSKVIDITNPDCFIFSELFSNIENIHTLMNTLAREISNLFFLRGIFLISEISIIYMLTITPYFYKRCIYDFGSQFLNYNENTTFIDTLRLFIVLKSINNVAKLLNIHPNTVKYRILKVVNSKMPYTTNITTDIWDLEFLIPLEMLKIETFD